MFQTSLIIETHKDEKVINLGNRIDNVFNGCNLQRLLIDI